MLTAPPPIVCRELKIYGQWISGGQRRLSRVANLSNHLSFVGVLLGSIMGLKERLMFFSVGLAHYMLCSAPLHSGAPLCSALLEQKPTAAACAWNLRHGDQISTAAD